MSKCKEISFLIFVSISDTEMEGNIMMNEKNEMSMMDKISTHGTISILYLKQLMSVPIWRRCNDEDSDSCGCKN